MTINHGINLVVALPAEASPLLAHFDLKMALDNPANGKGFRHYANDTMNLVVSGPGKIAVASAIDWLQGRLDPRVCHAWINIGIAGHNALAVGSAFIANKVIDAETGKSWYPPLPVRHSYPGDCLRTVDTPDFEYAQPGGVDMEGSGFIRAAQQHSAAELVHCLKVVSDNPASSASAISAGSVRELIDKQLSEIEGFLGDIAPLADELAAISSEPPHFISLTERYHFTVSETHQLRRLLTRCHTLQGNDYFTQSTLSSQHDGKAVLKTLRQILEDQPLKLGVA